MALVKYGLGIVQMSGSIAGDVHARNRFGNYKRARTKPVNPRSDRQSVARVAMMFLSEAWHESEMDDTKRGAWRVYADAINWNNKLGELVHLSGFNHFIRSNASRMAADLALVYDGPVDPTLPQPDDGFTIAGTADDQKIAVTFNGTDAWDDEDDAGMIIHMGEPQLASRNFFNGPWRFADSIDGDSITPPTSPVEIDAPFTLTTGQRFWCKALISRADGRLTNAFRCASAIVAAS